MKFAGKLAVYLSPRRKKCKVASMRKIKVNLGKNSYEVHVGSGWLGKIGSLLKKKGLSGKLVIITDPTVNRLFGETLRHNLIQDGFSVSTLLVPEGEEQKSLESAGRLYQELTDCYTERATPVLALGGGVIGDLAGFVAATYMRGVPLIQVPTTLLAQVDSSIGGKVAVDHGQLKNKIGTFYQPKMVVADIDTLNTLPKEELTSGLAEVIKSAAIRNQRFFAFLEDNLDRIKEGQPEVLGEVVFQTAGIKAEVVGEDEKDTGLRNILNYGHTIGHAIESASAFSLKHGSAVSIGMVAAAKISNKMGFLADTEVDRLANLAERVGLPIEIPNLKVEDVMQKMRYDKKVVRDKVRFVLLKSIGSAFITDEVSPSLVEQVLIGDEKT